MDGRTLYFSIFVSLHFFLGHSSSAAPAPNNPRTSSYGSLFDSCSAARTPGVALVGVMTTQGKVSKRHLIRGTYIASSQGSRIKFCFVTCGTHPLAGFVRAEAEAFKDLVLSCKENMNNGKNLFWYHYAYNHFIKDFGMIMTADDDTVIQANNLESALTSEILPKYRSVYYGRPCCNNHHHSGMYGLDSDLLAQLGPKLATAGELQAAGQEDALLKSWLDNIDHTVVNDEHRFIDHPWARQTWSADIKDNSHLIAVHQCKEDSR